MLRNGCGKKMEKARKVRGGGVRLADDACGVGGGRSSALRMSGYDMNESPVRA